MDWDFGAAGSNEVSRAGLLKVLELTRLIEYMDSRSGIQDRRID